jgi:hypothetical protein
MQYYLNVRKLILMLHPTPKLLQHFCYTFYQVGRKGRYLFYKKIKKFDEMPFFSDEWRNFDGETPKKRR